MLQEILVWLLFLLALGYVGSLLYSNFSPRRKACPKGCGSCALDLKKLEAQIGKTKK
jgi:hypothetical protein